MLTHLDLFSGIGGFALAAQWAGFTTIGFAETDVFCSKVLKKHWPTVRNYGDVKNIRAVPHVDLLTGGFPCQPFSSAGKRKGKDDDRYLWPEMLRIITENRPTWIVGENVVGMLDMAYDTVHVDLENAGYQVQSFIIPASATGAPHRRERVWIIAYAVCQRCDNGFDNTAKSQIQADWERDCKGVQTEWAELFPKSWPSFNFQDWFGFTTDAPSIKGQPSNKTVSPKKFQQGALIRRKDIRSQTEFDREKSKPPIPGMDDGLPNIVDRNKVLGNAIVPQVVYPILRLIALTTERL